MATKPKNNPDETPAAANGGGGKIVSADAFRKIERNEKVVEIGDGNAVRVRGLSVAQLDAINAELGEGVSEFRMMAAIAHAGLIEPEGISLDDLLEMSPAIVLLIGGEVAGISGMSESSVKAIEKSVRQE